MLKFVLPLLFLLGSTLIPPVSLAQSIVDSLGDIVGGDPTHLDVTRVKLRQVQDIVQVDIYPAAPIPAGNLAGIEATTVYELYMDVDGDASTGTPLGDIGYDYKLRADLYTWNGKSWIDANVYWSFDRSGNPGKQDGFFISAANLISQRFRWEFSLISLKWARIDWTLRIYYRDHWTERVPDAGHATLSIDTTVIPDLMTSSAGYVEVTCPETFRAVMDSFDVLSTLDAAAGLEGSLCQTAFANRPLKVMFNPWLNGVNYSGDPVMMGSWSWGSEPSWFIILHELGHNFTLASSRFQKLYPSGGYVSMGGDDWHFGTDFVEAWASMAALYAGAKICSAPESYGISSAAAANLSQQFTGLKNSFLGSLKTYEQSPDHSRLYPDLVDAILLTMADSFGVDVISRWYKVLHPPDSSWSALDLIKPVNDYTDAKIRSFTITAAGFSVAAGIDLRELFKSRWDFPIDDEVYEEVLPDIRTMIGEPTGASEENRPAETFALLGNFPNPFNAATTVVFDLPRGARVDLSLFDLLGRLVRKGTLGLLEPGRHHAVIEARDLASGAYLCMLETPWACVTRKCLLLK